MTIVSLEFLPEICLAHKINELILYLDFAVANTAKYIPESVIKIQAVEIPFEDVAGVNQMIYRQLVYSEQLVLPSRPETRVAATCCDSFLRKLR